MKIVCMFSIWSFAENTSVVKSMMLEKEILRQKFRFTPKRNSIFEEGASLKQNFLLPQNIIQFWGVGGQI